MYHPQLRTRTEARLPATVKFKITPENLLQEVYLDIARQIKRFENRGPGCFVGWVQVILDRKLTDAWRAAQCQARDIDREVPAGRERTHSHWDLLDRLYADSGTPGRVVRRQEAVGALPARLS